MLQEEARLIAERLENSRFKPSNGWLQSFKARHNLKMLTVCVESASVPQGTVEAWHSRVKDLVIGYVPKNIWNTDETGCFSEPYLIEPLLNLLHSVRVAKNQKTG